MTSMIAAWEKDQDKLAKQRHYLENLRNYLRDCKEEGTFDALLLQSLIHDYMIVTDVEIGMLLFEVQKWKNIS